MSILTTLTKMELAKILESVLAREPERDQGFRQEIRRLTKRSLYIIGTVEICLP